jgi:hypothetical protein|tara:strand:- start:37817 stop:37924 length:108 start_codon:yes stop_codon:yes gene_type:complete
MPTNKPLKNKNYFLLTVIITHIIIGIYNPDKVKKT